MKTLWTVGLVLALFVILSAGLLALWWAGRKWKGKALKQNADNTRQDISENFERIREDVADDTDKEAWDELQNNLP